MKLLKSTTTMAVISRLSSGIYQCLVFSANTFMPLYALDIYTFTFCSYTYLKLSIYLFLLAEIPVM
ncbi:hypothetical protein VCRA2113O324_100150 [Vibrio crassostreae]|nr:hypothetical protein VCRA2113O324_100150 [Vibrio crassostreae]CAK2239801.1 hypothetical protein VCRA2111O320_80002 [Vibrio crassostreae]CAK3654308.1 hypothetical protein VCRA2120O329_90002 [Vibrio crassostreae]